MLCFDSMEKKMKNNKKENSLCELCKKQATNFCYECSFYLCDSCFEYLHEKKVNSEHKKEEIDYFVSIYTKCPKHPENPMNLFCVDEKSKINIFFNLINI